MKTPETEYALGYTLGADRNAPVAGCPVAFIESLYQRLVVRAQREKHDPDPCVSAYWRGFLDGFESTNN